MFFFLASGKVGVVVDTLDDKLLQPDCTSPVVREALTVLSLKIKPPTAAMASFLQYLLSPLSPLSPPEDNFQSPYSTNHC